MNYTELSAAITDWLENQESTFASHKDQFIRLGERRLHIALELPSARKNATSNLTGNDPYLQLPSDVVSVLDLAIVSGSNVHTLLRKRAEGFIREAYPDPTSTGTPVYYSIFDENTIKVAPTPSSNINVEMTYHGVPDSIVDTNTSWLGTNCERALLYACLLEGYIFMKGDSDMIAKYDEQFQEEVVKISATVLRRSIGKDMFEASVNA